MRTYNVTYYDHNGIQGQTGGYEIRGNTRTHAKQLATRGATGTTTRMLLSVTTQAIEERIAIDSFAGCCKGWKPWVTL